MPVISCRIDGKPGFSCGKGGKCYAYTAGNSASRTAARRLAANQCIAIGEPVSTSKQDMVETAHLFTLLSSAINKADAPEKFIADFETTLTSIFLSEWLDISNRGIKVAMRAYRRRRRSKASVKAVQASLGRVMNGYGKAVNNTVKRSLKVFYQDVTQRFTKEFGLKVEKAVKEPGIDVSFTQMDANAVRVIQKLGVQTAGRYFPSSVERKTSEVIEQVILNEGLTIEQAAVKLEAELAAALGTEISSIIPTRFAANPQAYFRIVATNASVQATSVGRMIAMKDAGVEKYAVRAIIDKRTSNICRNLNGREFTVSKTMRSVDDFLDMEDDLGVDVMDLDNWEAVRNWFGSAGVDEPNDFEVREKFKGLITKTNQKDSAGNQMIDLNLWLPLGADSVDKYNNSLGNKQKGSPVFQQQGPQLGDTQTLS